MANTKQYERSELLDRAIELFRLNGYTATSTADLVDELGVNRKSMYAEFGSKQDLFEAALERYTDTHLSRVLAPIEAPDAGVAAIRDTFHSYGEAMDSPFLGRGCLMCNTAVERAALDPGSRRFVDAYFERFTTAFRNALANSQRQGELVESADLDELAGFLTTAMVGVSACLRAGAPPEQVKAACRVVTSVIEAQ